MKMRHAISLAAAGVLSLIPVCANAQPSEDQYIREPVNLDQTFDKSFENGCKYTVHVRGTVDPQNSNVSVAAIATCPNEQASVESLDVLDEGRVTWRQLADTITKRAAVMTVEHSFACTYAPTLRASGARVAMTDFDYRCTAV
jgi:hypothetical protein